MPDDRLEDAPTVRVVVDMDCEGLPVPDDRKRCDYLFVGEERNAAWVAPIELKSGKLKAGEVLEQLEGGIEIAEAWLPQGIPFRLVPVLAHGKTIHRNDLKALRSRKMRLRGQRKRTELIRCGESLAKALRP